MDPTVQVLLDERDITQLCYRYGTALDSRDWPLLRSCLAEDAVTVYEGSASSRARWPSRACAGRRWSRSTAVTT